MCVCGGGGGRVCVWVCVRGGGGWSKSRRYFIYHYHCLS